MATPKEKKYLQSCNKNNNLIHLAVFNNVIH